MDAHVTLPASFEAYRAEEVTDNVPGNQRVECLCCWRDVLLVGLHDGTIVQYAPIRPATGGEQWQPVKAQRSLDRKGLSQMEVVHNNQQQQQQLQQPRRQQPSSSSQRPAQGPRPLLLARSDAGVDLLTLPELQLKFQPMRSRGASAFAWSEQRNTLAVAVRRKLILYELHGSELREAGERVLPDTALGLDWLGPELLALATRAKYALINVVTGSVMDVSPTGSAPSPLIARCPGGSEMLLTRDTCSYYHNTKDGRYSRRSHLQWSEPIKALLASRHYAVALTAHGVEVRSTRRVAEQHVAQWMELGAGAASHSSLPPTAPGTAVAAPAGVPKHGAAAAPAGSSSGTDSPYAASVAGSVAGSVTTAPAIEPLAVPPAMGEDGSVFVAAARVGAGAGSGCCIYRLVAVSLEEQAHTLAELGEYSEALALAALLEEDEEEEEGGEAGEGQGQRSRAEDGRRRRELLEERLRLAYGHYLFRSGEYDEGMAQLALCRSAGPLVLLRLLPSLVPEKFRSLLPTAAAGQPLPDVPEPQGEAFIAAASCLLPYLLSHRTRATTALAADTAAAAEPASGNGGDSTTADKNASGKTVKAANGEGAAAGVAHGREAAAEDRRPQEQRQQQNGERQRNGQEDEEGNAQGLDCGRGQGDGAGKEEEVEPQVRRLSTDALLQPPSLPPRQLLVVLDTAIVAVMVAMPDSGALLRFVQLPNHVDLEEGEKVLSAAGMYAELVALCNASGRHEQGMELLRRLSQEPEGLSPRARGAAADLPGLPGVWAAVRYLVSLSPAAPHAATIQRHAGWILAADPEAGLSAFLHMRPPLDPSLALSILERHSRHYCGLYLETALQIGVALPQDYHNELLLIYLRDVLSKEPLQARRSAHRSDELRELLLSQRPDSASHRIKLFPDDFPAHFHHTPQQQQQLGQLARKLRQHEKGAGAGAAASTGAGGRGTPTREAHWGVGGIGGALARLFASAPASAGATPTLSRVGSAASLRQRLKGQGGEEEEEEEGGEASGESEESSLDSDEDSTEEEEDGVEGQRGKAVGGRGGKAGLLAPRRAPVRRAVAAGAGAGGKAAGAEGKKAKVGANEASPSGAMAAAGEGAAVAMHLGTWATSGSHWGWETSTPVSPAPSPPPAGLAPSPIAAAAAQEQQAQVREDGGKAHGGKGAGPPLPPKAARARHVRHASVDGSVPLAAQAKGDEEEKEAAGDKQGATKDAKAAPSQTHFRRHRSSAAAQPYPVAPAPAAPPTAEEATAAAAAAAAGPSLYQRLRELVYTSPYIDPSYVLDKLPPGELLEIRALMLERLGRHREALRLFVHAMHDLPAAEAYCDRVYDATVKAAGGTEAPYGGIFGAQARGGGGVAGAGAGTVNGELDVDGAVGLGRPAAEIYIELVKALYDGPESCPAAAAVAAAAAAAAAAAPHSVAADGAQATQGGLAAAALGDGGGAEGGGDGGGAAGGAAGGPTRLDAATWRLLARLLSRKRDRLDPLQVLSLLPDEVSVCDVVPWLEGALRFAVEARRNVAVLRQLRHAERFGALEGAVRCRQQRVLVGGERACSLCHKRIGGAVFVSYPEGHLAHYQCHIRSGGAGGGGGGEREGYGSRVGWAGGGGAGGE